MSVRYAAGSGWRIARSTCISTLIMIGTFAAVNQIAAGRLGQVSESPVNLPIPLKSVPAGFGDWTAREVPLSASVLREAANDDYLNRLYVNQESRLWATVYVAYSARPRTMLGHRPDICYVGAGWVRDSTVLSAFTSPSGQRYPCLIHRFHKPDENRDELVVLNFYIVNGMPSADERLFSGLQWRTPNINGNIARYVAQVQVSSSLENTVRTAAGEFVELLMPYLPDGNGRVAAAQVRGFANAASTPKQ